MPQLTPAQIQQISGLVANYILTQRQNYVGRAANLPAALRLQVNPLFRADVLNSSRFLVLENARVANPDF